MEDIILKRIRKLLVDLDFFSEDDLREISDEDLLNSSFQEDLKFNSLDYLLLVEKLKDEDRLSVLDEGIWDCHTVQELLVLIQKK